MSRAVMTKGVRVTQALAALLLVGCPGPGTATSASGTGESTGTSIMTDESTGATTGAPTTGTTDGTSTTGGSTGVGVTSGSTGEGTTTEESSTTGDGTTEAGSSGEGSTSTTGRVEGCLEPTETDPAAWGRGIDANVFFVGDLAVDPAGAVIASSWFSGQVDLGGGPLVADEGQRRFLVKYDGLGEHAWSLAYGGYQAGILEQGIAVDCAGNVFVAGAFYGEIEIGGTKLKAIEGFEVEGDVIYPTTDVLLAKFTPEGQLVWARRFGDEHYQRVKTVVTTDGGGVVVGGSIKGVLDLGGAQVVSDMRYDGLLAEFDANGNYVWHKSFGGPNDVDVVELERSPTGVLTIGGAASTDVDFGGGPLAVVGEQYEYLAQFEPNGAHRWSRRSVVDHWGIDVAVGPEGNAYLTGTKYNGPGKPSDVFVLAFDPSGASAWSRYGAADVHASGRALAVDADGVVAIAGHFDGTIDLGQPLSEPFATDIFVVRLTAAGQWVAGEKYDGSGGEEARAVRFGPDGELVLAGHFKNTLDLGAGKLVASDGEDLFVHRFSP